MALMDIVKRLLRLEERVAQMEVQGSQSWVWLTTQLTSTSWDGDSFSTTAKTLIDLSAVFGVPAGVSAVFVQVIMRDSGSASGSPQLFLSASSSAGVGLVFSCGGATNDIYVYQNGIVKCDANGDIYYQTAATGSGTLDIHLRILGYQL